MPKISTLFTVLLVLAVLSCEEEGPAFSETGANEAAIIGTELEEDTGLADDAPIGEAGVMDVSGHAEPSDPGHGMEPAAYGEVPPVSHAVQETPSLPGGETER